MNFIGFILGLDQQWNMFSPQPPSSNWWINIKAQLVDGIELELFSDEGLFRWVGTNFTGEPPNPVHKSFKNHRWFKYFENGFNSDFGDIRLLFGRYICREWNARHNKGRILWTFQVLLTSESINLDGSKPVRFLPNTLWNHQCFDAKPAFN